MVQTLQPLAIAIIILSPSLATIAVGLRVWCRVLFRQFYWDDALCVAAWILAVAEAFMLYGYAKESWQGYHYWDQPDFTTAQRVKASKFDIANQLIYNPILQLVKNSVIIFLWRLEDRRQHIRVALISLFAINTGLLVSVFIADLNQCQPINYYWNHWWMDTYNAEGEVIKKGGSCFEQVYFLLITAGLSVLTDILILLVPAAMVWHLQMPRKKKIAVWAVLSLGWIVTIIGILRIVLYYYRFKPDNIDRSYSVTFTTSAIEVNIAIIASCGPALKALSTRFIPNLFGSQSASRRTGTVYYTSDGFGGSGGYSRQLDHLDSKGRRPSDAQYGLRNVIPELHDTDGDSQEAIVRTESLQMKGNDFDFGMDEPTEPRRTYQHRPSH